MYSHNISFTGAVDSGKSTLISVLKNNILDDGKGSARSKVVKHNHELKKIYIPNDEDKKCINDRLFNTKLTPKAIQAICHDEISY